MKSRFLNPLFLFCLFIIPAFVFSCRMLVSMPDIYMAGSIDATDPVTGITAAQACYWKNGQITLMPKAAADIEQAYDLTVLHGRVFLAGSRRVNGGAFTTPCRWDRGQRIDLPYTGTGGECFTITASQEHILCAGNFDPMTPTPVYWIDGVPSPLLDDTHAVLPGGATEIKVVGGTTFIAGFFIVSGTNTPCYWVDGVPYLLADPVGQNAIAKSIFVADGIIYNGGTYYSGPSQIPCYWMNQSQPIVLPNHPSSDNASVSSIWVENRNVYITGYYMIASIATPCVWINGVLNILPKVPGSDTRALGVSVQNGAVYVAGYYSIGPTTVPCCWVNGQRLDFTAGATNASVIVQAIYIPR